MGKPGLFRMWVPKGARDEKRNTISTSTGNNILCSCERERKGYGDVPDARTSSLPEEVMPTLTR